MTISKTQQLARFVSNLRYPDLPPEVASKVKEIALHAWGVQLAASTLPWSKKVYRVIRSQGGCPDSTVVNYGLRTTPMNAAFINSAFSHGFELDDNHHRSSVKAGCVTVPVALAVGEQQLSSGKDFLTALAAGYEIMTRVGMMIHKTVLEQGAHPTGGTGGFGAAAVTGKLMGLDEATLAYALGGGGAQRAGLNEIPSSGRGHLKRTFGAMAAVNGIRSALLAREGITSPLTTLDYGHGFARTFDASKESVEMLTDGLGQDWELLNTHYKIYAQDGYIQPMTEAFKAMRQKHTFSVDDIEAVWLGTNKIAHDDIIGPIREPRDVTDAQFSANFSAALYLVTGSGSFDAYTDDNLLDPAIRELASRVVLEVDAEIEAEFQRDRHRGAKVAVRLKDGTEYTEKVEALRLMSPLDLDEKYRTLSRLVLDDATSQRLLETAHNLEAVPNIATVATLLVANS